MEILASDVRGWLVKKQKSRLVDQLESDGDSLELTSGDAAFRTSFNVATATISGRTERRVSTLA